MTGTPAQATRQDFAGRIADWDADKILSLVVERNALSERLVALEAVLRLLWSDWTGGMEGDDVFAAHGAKIIVALGAKP
jgi:hypothetical protein